MKKIIEKIIYCICNVNSILFLIVCENGNMSEVLYLLEVIFNVNE